jgi:LysM repeat protein
MSTLQDIVGLNPQINNPNLIYPGQSVLLPDGTSHTVVKGDNLTYISNKFDKNQIERNINPAANTAADQVANEEDRADPETQNTGTDDGEVADEDLPDDEEAQIEEDETDEPEDPVPDPDDEEPGDGETTEDADETPPDDTQQVGGNNDKYDVPTENNPLSSYASYTYNLNWHVLTKEDYSAMSKGLPWRPSRNLVSGANRYGEMYTGQNAGYGTYRDPAFMDDFYFSDFKLSTVIGLNANARGTNMISMSFTIIEPYGMTLMDRILDINVNELGAKNYLDNPYLIELNFFGMSDDGVPTLIVEQTKWFPIKLTGMKIKATVQGSEYAITAVPFNHQALFESLQDIKTRMEVTASTVGEYFDSTSLDGLAQEQIDNFREQDAAAKAKAKKDADNNAALRKAAENDPRLSEAAVYDPPREPVKNEARNTTITTKSFSAAYNAWNLAEQKNGAIEFADQIKFVIDKDIADSKIVDPKKNSIRNVPATTAKAQAQTTSDGKAPAATADFKSAIHSLDAGTKVQDIINLVMPNSEFFKKQITDSATEAKNKKKPQCDVAELNSESKPFFMYKVIPTIELGGYDRERNVWGKIVTFHVMKYAVYNNQDDRVPKSLPPKAVKKYDYFYTGHNTDIIGFDIAFNALYYTAVNVDKGKGGATSGATAQDDTGKNKETLDKHCANVIDPRMTKPVSQTQQTSAGGVLDNSDTVNAASVMQSFYTSAGGDMIGIKLQIIGDPTFIKQDDIFAPPTITGLDTKNPFVEGTGSLAMDNGEIYCYLTFNTPVDFDDTTGLMRKDGKYQVSSFSGYYRILNVENEFRGGKFTQTLELVRYPNQPAGLTNRHAGTGTDDREPEEEMSDNPDIAGNDVDPEPPEYPEEPDQPEADPEEDSDEPPEEEDPEPTFPPEDDEINNIAEDGDTLDMDEATSDDGNTVPVQDAAPVPDTKDYLIKPGDNLTKIAKANHTTVDYLTLINPQIKNPDLIYSGQTMNVPNK